MEATRIRILCENRAHLPKGILGEHGFAALIRTPDSTLLLDTGQGLSLSANARALKIDLKELDALALSHGHYDHTGGLGQIPRQENVLPIHAHPDIFRDKFLRAEASDDPAFIGMPMTREKIEATLNARFRLHTSISEIVPGVLFSGEIPRVTPFEPPDPRLMVRTENGLITDPFLDDAALMVETGSGPVVITGCAHSGIVNILEHFAGQTGHKHFHAVIGGTHLDFTDDTGRLRETMDAFDRFDIRLIAVSHCTGNTAAAVLYHRFCDRFAFAGAGWQAEF